MTEKSLIDSSLEFGKDYIRGGNELCCQAMFDDKDGKKIMTMLVFRNGKEKVQARESLFKMIEVMGVKEYVLLQECWMSSPEEGQIVVQPRRMVDRREALVVSRFGEDRKNIIKTVMFNRKNDMIEFEDEMKQEGQIQSMWDYWCDRKEVEKKLDKVMDEHNEEVRNQMVKKISDEFKDELKNIKSDEEFLKLMKNVEIRAEQLWSEQNKKILEDTEKEDD